jgi:hypothetical protein
MYVYIESERWTDDKGFTRILYTVGHYDPSGKWIAESDHSDGEEAAKRVRYLNGGNPSEAEIRAALDFGKTAEQHLR